jgi:ElaB/YqjD/DUF883 family membrane-anchored ribosome-binding protein
MAAQSPDEPLQDKPTDFGAQLEAIRDEIAAVSRQVSDYVASRAGEAQEYVAGRAGEAQEIASRTVDRVQEAIERNPLAAVAVAAGAGLAVAVLFTSLRRSSRRDWSTWSAPEITRRDFQELARDLSESVRGAYDRAASGRTYADVGDRLLEFLSNLSRSLPQPVASAMAAAGEKLSAGMKSRPNGGT